MAIAPASVSKSFRTEGVIVKIPTQAKPMRVKRLPLHIILPHQMYASKFQPFRLVINLKMVDAADQSLPVTSFSPPLEIRVRYTAADFKAANGLPSLAYWDGNVWTPCSFTHQYRGKPEAGGWVVANVDQWGDPTLALGT